MNNQRIKEDLLKKVDGRFEELEGKLLEEMGYRWKGGMRVAEGKMQDKTADIDLSMQDMNENIKQHIQKTKNKVRDDFTQAFA